MHKKLTAPRALTALFARRVIRLATIIASGIILGVIALAWVLAYFFSPWWWLLTVPFVIAFGLFMIVRIVVMVIVRLIHPNDLSKEQVAAMNGFIDKIQTILEARSTPPFLIVLICLKDLLLYRDITTIKNLIKDTAGLRKEYAEIEKLF